MKVIFHQRFYEVYAHDPAAAPGRMEAIVKALEGKYEFLEPGACFREGSGEGPWKEPYSIGQGRPHGL